jgi:hypothetical protein
MKAYGGNGGEWSASCPCHFTPQGWSPKYPLVRHDGPQSQSGRCGEQKNIMVPLGSNPTPPTRSLVAIPVLFWGRKCSKHCVQSVYLLQLSENTCNQNAGTSKEIAAVVIDLLRSKLLDHFIASWNPFVLSDIFRKPSADPHFSSSTHEG